jgi:hypothetical protein
MPRSSTAPGKGLEGKVSRHLALPMVSCKCRRRQQDGRLACRGPHPYSRDRI